MSSRTVGSEYERAVATDREYFELGADTANLPGAVMAWMPGLSSLPGAAVVHRVDPDVVVARGEGWVEQTEQALAGLGATLARVYVDGSTSAAGPLFRRAGYKGRRELVFVGSLPEPPPEIALEPVATADDWQAKRQLHEAVQAPPDGHGCEAAYWVELERRKCEAGMEMFLARKDGEVIGSAGLLCGESIARIKNIVVHPAHRRRSVGRAILSHIATIGRGRGIARQCILAVEGDPGELLYRACGMHIAGVQVEWSKLLARGTE